MKHLNADLDNITNVQTIKTPVGAIRAIGVDSANDIVLTGAIGSGGGDLSVNECDTQIVSTNFRFEDNTNTEFPKGANMVTLEDNSGFGNTFIYQFDIDDTADLPTLTNLTQLDGTALTTSFTAVLPGVITVSGGPNRGEVVFRYRSARRNADGSLTLAGLVTTVGDGNSRSFDYTARTSGSTGGAGTIATYNDTGFGVGNFNSGGFNLVRSNFSRGRIAGIFIEPNSTTERDTILGDLGLTAANINNVRANVSENVDFTFTNGSNNFTITIHQVIFTTANNFYIVGRSPFQDIQPDMFVNGNGVFSPNGNTWTMTYSVGGTVTTTVGGIEWISGTGSWSRGDGTDTATICIGDASGDTGDINGGGDLNIGGQITQMNANGPVIANEEGTLDVANIYNNTLPFWTGSTFDNSPFTVEGDNVRLANGNLLIGTGTQTISEDAILISHPDNSSNQVNINTGNGTTVLPSLSVTDGTTSMSLVTGGLTAGTGDQLTLSANDQNINLSTSGTINLGFGNTPTVSVPGTLRGAGANDSPTINIPTVNAAGTATSTAGYSVVIVPSGTTITTRDSNTIYLELE